MNQYLRTAALLAGLGLTVLLAGCPGMPGMPGSSGGGSAAQQTPPGVLPPPGLTSGGVRTLMGTTVTPPENAFLLVSYTTSGGASVQKATARRITISENAVLFEGMNYDGRKANLPKDTNTVIPLSQLSSLSWSYEEKPTPPPSAPGRPGRAAPGLGRGAGSARGR